MMMFIWSPRLASALFDSSSRLQCSQRVYIPPHSSNNKAGLHKNRAADVSTCLYASCAADKGDNINLVLNMVCKQSFFCQILDCQILCWSSGLCLSVKRLVSCFSSRFTFENKQTRPYCEALSNHAWVTGFTIYFMKSPMIVIRHPLSDPFVL